MQLFLPVLLTDIEHWYCVVVNLVDKRIEVVDSMVLKTTDKKVATKTVVSTGQSCRDVVQRVESDSDKATTAYPME
ncbi:hypothetical protein C3L33_23212, partial [Rhododendron williamsianum]